MKESISYAFLLNIIFIFIFVCAAIIMGTLSYYKAFRANKIISETIEKYEGYNCLSKEEIARKLSTIGYNVPYEVKCKNEGHCEADGELGYKVIAYNLDFDTSNTNMDSNNSSTKTAIIYGEQMNSPYRCERKKIGSEEEKWVCTTNKNYQYGIYTYMYTELPVIASILRIPLYTKTSQLYEFRNFYVEKNAGNNMTITEVESSFDNLYTKTVENGKIYVSDSKGQETDEKNARDKLFDAIFKLYSKASVGNGEYNVEYALYNLLGTGASNKRARIILQLMEESSPNKRFDSALASRIAAFGKDGMYESDKRIRSCGATPLDYSKIN